MSNEYEQSTTFVTNSTRTVVDRKTLKVTNFVSCEIVLFRYSVIQNRTKNRLDSPYPPPEIGQRIRTCIACSSVSELNLKKKKTVAIVLRRNRTMFHRYPPYRIVIRKIANSPTPHFSSYKPNLYKCV